jgi:hypothetical protein
MPDFFEAIASIRLVADFSGGAEIKTAETGISS